MRTADVAVIGGGLLGCFVARNLRRYDLSVLLIEQQNDVCTGLSRANSAIIYPGYDNEPGSLKAELTLQACRNMDSLCRDLDVPFSRCGSLMVSTSAEADKVLEKKLENGRVLGMERLELLSGSAARAVEPGLSGEVRSALFCPDTGVVDPWALCYGAYENALDNGAEAVLSCRVTGIRSQSGGYFLETTRDSISCRAVINCAGLHADAVHELFAPPSVRIRTDASDYLVLSGAPGAPGHVIFSETPSGKGLTAVPATDGAVLLCGTPRPVCAEATASDRAGLESLRTGFASLLPGMKDISILHSFAALRPNPYYAEETASASAGRRNIPDFSVVETGPGFFSFIGIKTPGLTCSDALGATVSARIADLLNAEPNPAFSPVRTGIPRVSSLTGAERAAYARTRSAARAVVCLCGDVTEEEILDSIRRGARSISGVKRRCGALLGACQGSRCRIRIAELLSRTLGSPVQWYLDHDDTY